jgi:hypothetical protein
MKPDATSKRALFKGPPEHLLTRQRQKMSMPDKKYATPHSYTRWSKGHPLSKPFCKVVHTVHFGSIYIFKIRLVLVGGFVGSPDVPGFSII